MKYTRYQIMNVAQYVMLVVAIIAFIGSCIAAPFMQQAMFNKKYLNAISTNNPVERELAGKLTSTFENSGVRAENGFVLWGNGYNKAPTHFVFVEDGKKYNPIPLKGVDLDGELVFDSVEYEFVPAV